MPISGVHSASIWSPRSSETTSISACLPIRLFVTASRNGAQPFRSISVAAMILLGDTTGAGYGLSARGCALTLVHTPPAPPAAAPDTVLIRGISYRGNHQ